MNQAMTRIFVYGTLKKGFPNYHFLDKPPSGKVELVGSGETKESYPMVIGTGALIPFLLPFPGKGSQIKGEVYEVDQEALLHLDDLEDHPIWYKRMPCAVILTNCNEISCEAYFLMNSKPELLQKIFYNEYTPDHAKGYCDAKLVARLPSLKSEVQLS